MEINILLESDISHSVPECYIVCITIGCFIGQLAQNICLKTGAAEVNTIIYIIVSQAQSERTRFFQIHLAIADTCVPSPIIVMINTCILPVFTEYTEITCRYYQVNTNQIIMFITGETDIIYAQLSSFQICTAFGKEYIAVSNQYLSLIHI